VESEPGPENNRQIYQSLFIKNPVYLNFASNRQLNKNIATISFFL
jgi:hypothetical protein